MGCLAAYPNGAVAPKGYAPHTKGRDLVLSPRGFGATNQREGRDRDTLGEVKPLAFTSMLISESANREISSPPNGIPSNCDTCKNDGVDREVRPVCR
jgi:hypothetical protein